MLHQETEQAQSKTGSATAIALLMGLLFVAGILPSTGKVVVDDTVSPMRSRIEPNPLEASFFILMALCPAACVFAGEYSRRKIFVRIGLAILGVEVLFIFLRPLIISFLN